MRKLILGILMLIASSSFGNSTYSKIDFDNFITKHQDLERRGCCSHHGGVSYCGYDGYYVCADGWKSSCKCD